MVYECRHRIWMGKTNEWNADDFVQKTVGLKGCPVRFVTAYGPRENETHAIIAFIYKAVENMDPYEVWGQWSASERLYLCWRDVEDSY